MKLCKNELLSIDGGGTISSGMVCLITAAVGFLIRIVDGIFRPVACNK